MIQTQLLQLQPPYQVIYCGGEVGLHVATLIVVDERRGKEGRYLGIETHSYPVVSYTNKEYASEGFFQYVPPSEGVVWNHAELGECMGITLADGHKLAWDEYMSFIRGALSANPRNTSFITSLAVNLNALGVVVDKPAIDHGDVFEVWLYHDTNHDLCHTESALETYMCAPWGEVEDMVQLMLRQAYAYMTVMRTWAWNPFVFKAKDNDCLALAERLNEAWRKQLSNEPF